MDDNGHVFEGAIERLAQAGITVGCNPPVNNLKLPQRLRHPGSDGSVPEAGSRGLARRMSVRGVGRRAGGVSIVAVLVATSVLVLGVGLAWADTVAMLVQTVDSGAWSPASNDPSGCGLHLGGRRVSVRGRHQSQPARFQRLDDGHPHR